MVREEGPGPSGGGVADPLAATLYAATQAGLGSLDEVLDLTPAQVNRVVAAGTARRRRPARNLMTEHGKGARVL